MNMTEAIKSMINSGDIPLSRSQGFILSLSMGTAYWGIGKFYLADNKTYGSCFIGSPSGVTVYSCTADTWTATPI